MIMDYAKVEKLSYTMINKQNALKVFTNVGEMIVPNGNFEPNNPALQVMAFLDVRPSTMDKARGKHIPVTADGNGNIVIHNIVFNNGKDLLEQAEWMDVG